MATASAPTSNLDGFVLDGSGSDACMDASDSSGCEEDCCEDEDRKYGRKRVMGVAQTWKQDFSDAALVVFDQCATCTILSKPVVVQNTNAVIPHKIIANALAWRRMRSVDDRPTGSAFLLSHDNELQMTIEVTLVNPLVCETARDLQRVALVQPRYSAVAAAAGTCSASDFIEFDLPHVRLQDMETVRQALVKDEEQGYLPVREVVAGTALDKLIVHVNEEETKGSLQTGQQWQAPVSDSVHPRQVWSVTKRFLRDLSSSVRECTQLHAQRELQPLGLLHNCELSDRSFRAFIH